MNKNNNLNLFDADADLQFSEEKTQYCDVHLLAYYLNISPRRVQQLVRRGIIPRARKGKYSLISCIHDYLSYLRAILNFFITKRANQKDSFLESYRSPHHDNYFYKKKDRQKMTGHMGGT